MSEKPLAIARIDDLCRHLRNTLAKSNDPLPRSMQGQLVGIVSDFLRKQLAGDTVIHPGTTKMARWGGCKDRQSRENLRRLRIYGIVCPTDYANGGRRATRFFVSIPHIKRLLVASGANPSPALIEKLDDAASRVRNPAENPAVRGAENPALMPALTADGIQIETGPSFSQARSLFRVVSGGRG